MKYLIAILVLTLSLCTEVNRHVCDAEGKYYCPDHFECCKRTTKEGYTCCYETKACTSDGEHCYMFNMFKGKMERKRALPSTEIEASNEFNGPKEDIETFGLALLKQIGFFDFVPKTCTCYKEAPKAIIPVVKDIIQQVKEIKTFTDVVKVATDILTIKYPRIMAIYLQHCEFAPQELRDKFLVVKEYVTRPTFFKDILTNLKTNLNPVLLGIKRMILAIKAQDMTGAGTSLGEILVILFKRLN